MFNHLVIKLIGILFILAALIYVRRKYFFLSIQSVKNQHIKIEEELKNLKEKFKDDSRYFRASTLITFKNELLGLKQTLVKDANFFLIIKKRQLLNEIIQFEIGLEKERDQINLQFFEKEKARCKSIFCAKDGTYLLTDEQIKAVLSDDDRNLIIAGAGSGKTRVIDFKVRYLVNYKKVNPNKIILLSFSRKSAGDLIKKVSESISGVEVRTIHSFSSQTIGNHGKQLFVEQNKELDFFIIKALAQTLKEKDAFRLFYEFYEKFFSNIKPLIFYKSIDELRLDLKKSNSKLEKSDQFEEIKIKRSMNTLKGDYVRSVDERFIADFLFLHKINYEYEKKYILSGDNYYPDFYLVDYGVYLEHFALTAEGSVPSWFESPQKYLDGMKWKRELHNKNKTKLIESYSYLLNRSNTSEYLSQLLEKNGISVNLNLQDEEAYSKITKQFSRLFVKFYNTFKLSGFSLDELKNKYTELRYSLFLQFFGRFYLHFERLVQSQNKMDFSDLIIEATNKYQKGLAREYDYIIVDELQDTSNLAMNFLNQVYQINSSATLFCVGDDWQSIYGFSGSDVTIISNYERKYLNVSVQKINSNFRSHEKIVNLGKQFISKNPTQISKEVISKNDNFKNSEIAFLSFEKMQNKIQSIPDSESIFVLYRYNDDCPAQQGIFNDSFWLDRSRKPVKKSTCTKNISLMTIHASKGLEAQHVFLLFPDGVRRKFPSEIEDHFVFNMLKSQVDDFPFSEERRLMYVAITRAKQNLYFVSPSGLNDPNSVFWDELKEMI